MRRIALIASFALFSLGSISTAEAQRGCSTNGQAIGGVVGAVAGGTVGGLITNDRRGRSFRGDSGFRRGGFSGGRGFRRGRGFRGGRGFRRNNNGLGIAIGAIAGGLIGSQIAAAQDRNCRALQSRYQTRAPFGGTRQDRRSNSAPFGGQQPYQTQPTRTSAPVSPPPPLSPPASQPRQQSSRVFQPVCQFVTQTTELPNGQRTSQQVEVCQFSPNGEWIPR